ncbi:MAG: FHA domain-containing protein [Planctomycetes bacterium]|nr:FHA domain-containing protein [Planctomycetota bacterium]
MSYLKIIDRNGKPHILELTKDRYVIGRDSDRDVQLNDQTVSRTHAEIFKFGDHYIVRDLNATNGVYVNNEKIEEEILKNKDEITIGSTLLIYESDPPQELSQVPNGPEDFDTTLVLHEGQQEQQQAAQKSVRTYAITYDESPYNIATELIEFMKETENEPNFYSFIAEKISNYLKSQSTYIIKVDASKMQLDVLGYFAIGGEKNQFSKTIVKKAVSSQKCILTSDALSDENFSFSESIVIRRIGSAMCIPYLYGNNKIVMYTHRTANQEPYSQSQFELALLISTILWANINK